MAHRCSLCDRTDDKKIILLASQYFSGPYLKDNRNPGAELCQECVDAINETIYEDEEDAPVSPFPNY